ncbi:uncharacterized protein EMH_0088220 [Eimeria mitis]|uniref:Secreted protein n=1 Tax=Eimeria mitis TaxID=44415 RepID=U6KM24_9EIME|nr:uncharacterized protein EMH_0088220 [Eimeria mitis]CDJ36508.1 hypothetical protein EMH_0088220 [Eimeria mitis]
MLRVVLVSLFLALLLACLWVESEAFRPPNVPVGKTQAACHATSSSRLQLEDDQSYQAPNEVVPLVVLRESAIQWRGRESQRGRGHIGERLVPPDDKFPTTLQGTRAAKERHVCADSRIPDVLGRFAIPRRLGLVQLPLRDHRSRIEDVLLVAFVAFVVFESVHLHQMPKHAL